MLTYEPLIPEVLSKLLAHDPSARKAVAMNRKTALLASILFLCIIATLSAEGWKTIGANSQHNGRGDVTGPAEAHVDWQGTTESTLFGCQIYIHDGRMVTMRFQTVDVSPILCYDLYTGEELWDVDFPGAKSRSMPLGFQDGKIYAVNYQENSGGDDLHCLDPADGSIIWTAEDKVRFTIAHNLCYTDDGDLVVPAFTYLFRVDHTDGTTKWKTNRPVPNTSAETLCLYGDKAYGFEGYINTDKTLVAYDLERGTKLYESDPLPGHGDQEVPLMIGPDGTIYVIRDGTGLIRALQDTGTGFTELWTAPTGTAANGVGSTGQFGVGTDGSLYFVASDMQSLNRIDPATGTIIDTSDPLAGDLDPRITVDTTGTLYVCTGTASDGKLYALAPDLTELWQETFYYNYYSGPALGEHGHLAMAGNGTTLKVYFKENPLIADLAEIEASTAATVNFTLDAGTASAGRTYLLLGTLSGTQPGTPLPGGLETLPVNWDVFTDVVFLLLNSAVFDDFLGVLDGSGQGAAQLNSPGGLPPIAIGVAMHYAFTINNPFDFASNPIAVQIVP
jgi:outer membrane protein assembly factor BamB